MYQCILGKISNLSTDPLASTFADMAPPGVRNASWLAGRTLLARALSPAPFPRIIVGDQGKPAFADALPFWFNLSHSGDDIALLLSDEGEVGCDIEVIRPRENWQELANAVFSVAEHDELEREKSEDKLSAFWKIWTRKEAILKQKGGNLWHIADIDSTLETYLVSHLQFGIISLAVCTPTAFNLTPELIHNK